MRSVACLAALATVTLAEVPAAAQATDLALTATIAALDAKVFGAYNTCDLDAFGGYFAPDVEFYHDTGGVTFDRALVLANTEKYICHKVTRELIPGTLQVHPLKDYGAIEEGEHRFCQVGGSCEGVAKFLMIWRFADDKWVITRVVSHGLRALDEPEKPLAQ